MRRLLLAAVAAVVALVPIAAQASPRSDAGVFAGLGTWVDIYDAPAYRSPGPTAAKIAARGVKTVYVETANDRSTVDVVNPKALGLFVDALKARGIRVVAWYLPGFVKPAVDARRARAMLLFRTPNGASFDGVALDIESLSLKSASLRTARLITLSKILRNEGGDMPIAAITYPSRGFERHPTWWPRFPWQQVTALVDAWIPMAYSGGGFKGYDATYGYVARSLRLLRNAVGPDVPIHAAGGVAEPDERRGAEGVRRRGHGRRLGDGVEPLRLPDHRPAGVGRAEAARDVLNGGGGREPRRLGDRKQASLGASIREPGTLDGEDELLELRPFALPLSDAAVRGLGLDGAPDQPCPDRRRRAPRRLSRAWIPRIRCAGDRRSRRRVQATAKRVPRPHPVVRERVRPTPRCRAGRAPTT